MAFDENKVLEAVAKYLQKEQFEKAIKECRKALEVEPKSVRILLKLAEAHQKHADAGLAADCLAKVAEFHAGEGFFLKAVGALKQVVALDPDRGDPRLKLADLYEQLGLTAEAQEQLRLGIEAFEKSGKTGPAMAAIGKLLQFDPADLWGRLKLGQLYEGAGMKSEAILEYRWAVEQLRLQNRPDDRARVMERLRALGAG